MKLPSQTRQVHWRRQPLPLCLLTFMENQWGKQAWLENKYDRARRWASRHVTGRYQVPQHGGHLSAQVLAHKMQLRVCFNSIIATNPSLFLDLPRLLLIAELNYPPSYTASKTQKKKIRKRYALEVSVFQTDYML